MSHVTGNPNEAWETEGLEEHQFGFLAALLIHFPEIASVRTWADESALSITFLLESEPDLETVATFEDRLNRALAALSRLLGDRTLRTAHVSARSFNDLSSLRVVRSLDTIIAEEFPILRGMLTETFGKLVIAESPTNDSGEPDWALELGEEDETMPLDYTLRRFKASAAKGHLYGFRDGARVLVYRS